MPYQYITTEIIGFFNFLLPGFITSFLFYSLTSVPKKSEFESTVMALIYTVVINSIVEVFGMFLLAIGSVYFSVGAWASPVKTLWSVLLALLLGFLLTFIYNNDLLHKLLRKKIWCNHKITTQTSYPTEWYGTFSETQTPSTYIVLHFIDGKRIMGWPLECPSFPKNGHFVLKKARWLTENNEQIELTNVDKIMLDATNIVIVEFVKSQETENES